MLNYNKMVLLEQTYKTLLILVLISDAVLIINARARSLNEDVTCETHDGFSGRCVVIASCPRLNKLLQDFRNNTAPKGALDIIRNSICHTEPMRVCCKLEPPVLPPVTTKPRQQVQPPCGISSLGQRIVGGVNAKLFAWPWMALIQAKNPGTAVTFTCGGALISDRYVLTAAHCTNENPAQRSLRILFVRLGDHDLTKNPDCNQFNRCAKEHLDAGVDKVIVHREYEKDCRGCHDIALIRLSNPITPDLSGIFPICLPTNFENQLQLDPTDLQKSDRLAYIAGWGSISKDPFRFVRPKILQEAEIPFGTTDWCTQRLKSYPNPESVFCAGDSGNDEADSCRGDSGGPIMMSGTSADNDIKWYVVGIVSRGPTVCGMQGSQSIYTNVTYYLPWISEKMRLYGDT